MSTVAVVTGATRGLGRGIARALASKGHTVCVTGRDAAELASVGKEIADAGGTPLTIVCDHSDDEQVKEAFARVKSDLGRLDILVNNVAAVHPVELVTLGGFWEKPLKLVDMIEIGLRSAYVASWHAAPLLVEARKGLIASISFYGAVSYFHGAAYGATKAGTDKMTADMAEDLAQYGVAAISLWPGFILSDALRSLPPEQISDQLREELPRFETPEFTGLLIDALYHDPALLEMNGKALIGAELAERYGISDTDGKKPLSYRATMGSPAEYNNIVPPELPGGGR